MSIYKKFIDSAAAPAASSSSSSPPQRQKSCPAGRAPVVRMSPALLSSASNTLSSTPLSRAHYRRMVPAEEFRNWPDNSADLENQHQHYVRLQQQHRAPPPAHSQARLVQLNPIPMSASSSNSNIYQQRAGPISMAAHAKSCGNLRSRRAPVLVSPQQAASDLTRRKQRTEAAAASPSQCAAKLDSLFKTNDPVLLEWMQAMRFDTELECLTALQARTLAIDDNLAGALSVRNSQVAIQETRLESDYILDLSDILIDMLPINLRTIDRFALEFSNLWALLVRQTEAQTRAQQNTYTNCQNNLTIINCTPRKSLASARTLRPLDDLANKIRTMCLEMANSINGHQESCQPTSERPIDNGHFEAVLRRLKELYGKFVEISIRAECANIVRALAFDFNAGAASSSSSSNHNNNNGHTLAATSSGLEHAPASSASLRPVRVFQTSAAQLPLKWALIALWQLTKGDGYICRLLTEMWQTGSSEAAPTGGRLASGPAGKPASGVAKRLDYSTKYAPTKPGAASSSSAQLAPAAPLHEIRDKLSRSGEKPYQICQRFCENQKALLRQQQQRANPPCARLGALGSALKSLQPAKQLSTIELLIDIIISQPNRHERVDVLNFMQNTRLVDLDDEQPDQSVSAAFYTSNQYKVAALRILNHLCINEQAIKTILRCFSTPPPKAGHPAPQNRIIKSIFECHQTAQEHIYQNETIFNAKRAPSARRSRKRARQVLNPIECNEEYSDYGSRQTSSAPTSGSVFGGDAGSASGQSSNNNNGGGDDDDDDDEGDDAVVSEALRLLIQLTTPFHRSNQGHDYYTLIGRFSIESLVRFLTNIVKTATGREMVLLSLSALANISFITTEPMKACETSRAILDMFRNSKARSKDLELRDQTVTILANMADKNPFEIVSNGGLTFLLSCLEMCPTRMSNYKLICEQLGGGAGAGAEEQQPAESNQYARIGSDLRDDNDYGSSSRRFNMENKPRDRKPIQMSDEFFDDLDCVCDSQQAKQTNMPMLCLARLRPNELAALERIHQKTAVAFARLSIDSSTTRMVLKYGGVKQMIDLCKLSNRRNHSDTVLIACLAALRKIEKVVGREIFRHYNALDLIELELNQALEIYGRLYASEV